MCHVKPGPRCSAHTAKALAKATARKEAALTSGDTAAYEAARDAETVARTEWLKTPAGIKHLRANGDLQLAQAYEKERTEAIQASKVAVADRAWEATEGKEHFGVRVGTRAQLLYGKNASARIGHNSMWNHDSNGDPVSVPREIHYFGTPAGSGMVVGHEWLTDEDAHYDADDLRSDDE